MYYRGRDMVLAHRGMRISKSDWNVFLGHAAATLSKFQVPEAEQRDVVAFVQSLKKDRRIASRKATRFRSSSPTAAVLRAELHIASRKAGITFAGCQIEMRASEYDCFWRERILV